MQVYQILHIPTGNCISSSNREKNDAVLFANLDSAQAMINSLVNRKSYICGAPLKDYKIGNLDMSMDFYIEEFDCIELPVINYLANQLVLEIK